MGEGAVMKAARWHGPFDMRVEQIEEPVSCPHDVKIEVACAWRASKSDEHTRWAYAAIYIDECTQHWGALLSPRYART
jgi:hypothetical protein